MIVNARVVNSSIASGNNWRVYITDNSNATILVFIPASTVADLELQEPPKAGTVVIVAGYRDVYRTDQEVIVVSKNGFVIVK